MPTPQDTLRLWLPHALMLALTALSIWLLAQVFAPISGPVLLAAALAALTQPLIFDPVHQITKRVLRFASVNWQRSIAAFAATMVLVGILLSPIALLMATTRFTQKTSTGEAVREVSAVTVAYKVLKGDAYWIDQVAAMAGDRFEQVHAIYTRLPLSRDEVVASVKRELSKPEVAQIGTTFIDYLLHGTGGFIAQMALALTALFYFYDFGPQWARGLMSYTPLTPEQRVDLRRRFRSAVFRVVTDTLGSAMMKGLALGLIAWLVGGFNFAVVALVTTFVSLLPVIGFTFVWAPLSTLLWAQHHEVRAVLLAILALVAAWLVQEMGERLTRGLVHRRSLWLSFLMFLGLVGGLIAFGFKGLVIAPAAVVIVVVLTSFWLPLYGLGTPEPDDDPRAIDQPSA